MARGVKYDLQLEPISNPVKSAEGDLLMAAGKSEGQANAIKGQTDANTLTFLGTTAIGAAKGKMESDLDASIKDTLSKLDVTREAEFNRTTQGQATQIATLLEQSGGLDSAPELIQQFKTDTKRYTDALAQGVLSRQEVIDRIAADVKKYSATMPGWASDFRKLAAERTGISNIDVYGIHKALTEKSAREKSAEEQMKADIELDKAIAKEYGVGLNAITPELRAFHQQRQQIAAAADVTQKRLQVSNATQEQADKSWGQLGMLRVNEVVAGLAGDIAQLGALNQDPKKIVESQEFGLKMSGKLAATAVMLESQIRSFTVPAPGRTAMSEKEASRLIGEVRSTFKNYEDMVKNVEGRNMFANIVKNSKGNMELLMNNFMLANPHTAVLKDIGVLPKLFEAKVALDDAEFERRFPGLLAPMKAIMTGPGQQAYAGLVSAAGTGQAVDLNTARTLNPNATQVATAEWVAQMQSIPKMPDASPQAQQAWVNFTKKVGENFSVRGRDLVAINQTFADPQTQAFIRNLPYEQRVAAIDPFLKNIDSGSVNVIKTVQELVASYNSPEKNIAAASGKGVEVKRNNLTGMFEVVDVQLPSKRAGMSSAETAGGAVVGARAGVATAQVTFEAQRERQRLTELVGDMNKMLTTFTLAASALVGGSVDIASIQNTMYNNYINNKADSLLSGFVPKNVTDGSYRSEKDLRSKVGNPEAEPPVTIKDLVK
jgi:hypothetical protein